MSKIKLCNIRTLIKYTFLIVIATVAIRTTIVFTRQAKTTTSIKMQTTGGILSTKENNFTNFLETILTNESTGEMEMKILTNKN
jgi:hypothetical protein